ncbi:MAG: methyltransferase domain-containing protein [Ruminococcus sp.]|nr:methyltransferase domain-containing protein [Ruminococcus sp.]
MRRFDIDQGNEFDFSHTSAQYARFRDIYPKSMYEKLIQFGIGKPEQRILDLGSGTAILPMNLYHTNAIFFSTDISEEQVRFGQKEAQRRGMDNIHFRVCPAENTGFDDNSFDVITAVQCFHYFDAERAAEEIRRVLKPSGLFCSIFMDWLPYQDEKIAEMEQLVIKYNPGWNGCGFQAYHYSFPEWANDRFEIETIHSYNATLRFSKESWLGRVLTCRGIGASLPAEKINSFSREYQKLLSRYQDPLLLKHQIHMEIYRSTK